ncbi:hypothetical protein Tco_0727718 [Tanacetum coccineum]|uniref:Uncharacterized protein n=1 Tax=Tanacetum coccineum TaxID=301880 RepID=A0ABQ4YJY9_9ASTR
MITSLSGKKDNMTLQNLYVLCILYVNRQSIPEKSFSKKHRCTKISIQTEEEVVAKGESSVQRDPLFDEMPEDKIDHMKIENAQSEGRTREMVDEDNEFNEVRLSTEDVVSTETRKEFRPPTLKKLVQVTSTEEQREGTEEKVETAAGQIKSTEDQTKEEIASQASQTSTQTPTSMIFGDDETIATLLLQHGVTLKLALKKKRKVVEI